MDELAKDCNQVPRAELLCQPFVRPLLACLAIMLLLSPLVVSYARVVPTWDELYFLHRATCVNRSAYALDWSGIDQCLREMAKSPIMALLLLPAGAAEGAFERLALAPAFLAIFCFVQIVILVQLVAHMGMRWLVAILASSGIALLLPIRIAGTPYLADGLLSLVVANTFLMLLLQGSKSHVPAPLYFGMLWGFVFGVGVLTKLTYFYFAVLCLPCAFALSLRSHGLRYSLSMLGGALITGALPMLLLVRYGQGFWAHANAASFGTLASFYDDGLSRNDFLVTTFEGLGGWYSAAVLVILTMAFVWRADRLQLALTVWSLIVLAGYLWLASGSVNRDPRFFWPIWVALPFVLGSAVKRVEYRSLSVGLIASLTVIAVFISLPAAGRQDLENVALATKILEVFEREHTASTTDQPFRLILASDEPGFNVETFLLAKKLNYGRFSNLSIDTVVYDITRNLTAQDSIGRLLSSDVVIVRDPLYSAAPEWANRYRLTFFDALRKSCSQEESPVAGTFVFQHCRS